MRGSPLLTLGAVVAIFLLTGWPVWRLTRPESEKTVAAGQVAAPEPGQDKRIKRDLAFAVEFTSAPESFELLYGDRSLLSGRTPTRTFAGKVSLELPSEGADFIFHARWPDKTEAAAARVRISGNDITTVEKTFWSDGGAAEGVVPLNLK